MSNFQQVDQFCRTVALIIRRLLENNSMSTSETEEPNETQEK